MHSKTAHRVRDTLAKLSLCRTHVLGGRKFECEDCGEITTRYNSCGDRDCPQCSGAKRVDFHEKATRLIIDGVVYYQVVMTLPRELSDLALSNRKLFSELLPNAAWSVLSRAIEHEHGYRAGAISVLHTWNQRLENHWHVHLLVPGAGPSVSGDGWEEATPPPENSNDRGFYLVNADRLRTAFRKSVLRRLARAKASGKLSLRHHVELHSDENWDALCRALEAKTWVAYIQPPPTRESRAQHVVNYLTRYLTGGPMSDHRIVQGNRRDVTFLAREGTRTGGERRQVPITLSTRDFTERWSQHIQPTGLTKVRYYGGWSNTQIGSYQKLCHAVAPVASQHADSTALCDASASVSQPEAVTQSTEAEAADATVSDATDPDATESEAIFEPYQPDIVCEHCGSERLVAAGSTPKPSWRIVLGYGSAWCPAWYSAARDASDREFWDALMGEGFNDWYLENVIESAKAPAAPPAQPTQLYLPGFDCPTGYLIDSF